MPIGIYVIQEYDSGSPSNFHWRKGIMGYCSLGKNLWRKEGRLFAGESEAEKREMLESRPFF